MRGRFCLCILLFLGLGLAQQATAQRMIAVTQALSAAREAAAIYLRSVDLGRAQVLPATERLLGDEVRGLYLWPGGHAGLAITTGPPLAGIEAPVWWSGLDPAPFARTGGVLPAPQELADSQILKIWEQPGGAHWLVRAADRGDGTSRVLFQPWSASPVAAAALERMIPGRFLTGTAVRGPLGEALLVVERERGRFFVVIASMATGTPQLSEFELPLPQDALDPRPKLALATASGMGYVLFGGHDLSEAGAQVASWLVGFRLNGATPIPALKVLGAPQDAKYSLLPAGEASCWCITREPGRDVAYATLVHPGPAGLGKIRQYPLPGVRGSVLLTQNDQEDVLMAVDQRVELWPKGERGTHTRNFDAPIGALQWTSNGPTAACGGVIHLLDEATLATRQSVALNSGHVVAMREVAPASLPPGDDDGDGLGPEAERALGCDPLNPDSDADGYHDGVDPEPGRETQSLNLPPVLNLNGEAAGQELRALLVRPAPDPDTRWEISHDTNENRWLRVYPSTSYGARPVYVGLDPQFHLDPHPFIGVLRAAPMHGLSATADPPVREILFAVRPARQGASRILWLLDDPDGGDYAGLRADLAAPPLCFSHHLSRGAPFADLNETDILVLGTQAAARGDVPQHVLVDFVLQGGALLAVAESEAENSRDVSAWFTPFGFRLARESQLAPPFIVEGQSGPATAFRLPSAPLLGGIEAAPGALPVRPSDGAAQGPLFLRQFGLGRVAALSDARFLARDMRGFADALFRWLARTGLDIRDLDGDGVLDESEDANNNQALDPGETDRLRADTDGDGLDDGLEDRNRNGTVDDGETDPRNADSDGDGILDGADPTPCPALGAPRIAAAQPSSGPAEGGTVVTITGQGFDSTAACFFGERPGEVRRVPGADRIEVLTPPFEGGAPGPVDLRIELRGGEAKAVLPGGFAYSPRSRIMVALSSAVPGWQHNKIRNGVLGLRFDVPPGIEIGEVAVVLEAVPGDSFTLGAPRPGPDLPAAARFVQHRLLDDGRLMIVLGPGAPRPFPSGDLLRVPWEYTGAAPPRGGIQLRASQGSADAAPAAAAASPSGGQIDIEIAPFQLDLSATPSRGPSPSETRE